MKKLLNILMVCIITLALAGCTQKQSTGEQDVDREEVVEVTTLQKSSIARQIELSTTLEGYETVNIAPSITGNIEHIYVEVGSKVKAGDMLVRMDQNQYNTTKLTLTNLGIEYDRIKALRETGTVSQQAYDQIKLSYDQTKANLDFLAENTFVTARIPGVIAAKNYEDGELYSGAPILVLTQIHRLKAIVGIPETYFPLVREGIKLELRTDIYPDQVFPATIEIVYPTIDPKTHTFQAKLKIANSKHLLRPGMFVRTTLKLDEIDAFTVPYQAVLRLTGSNERYVFINNNGSAKRIAVTFGQRYDEVVEIVSNDLKEGDQLIVLGQDKLVDGTKLKIVNK